MTPPILYQSTRLLIIDKPAGLACHAGPHSGASVEDFFPYWRRGHDGPWLAHRLDTDTAGCLAIARRKTTLIALQAAFAAHTVQKTYWAVVRGVPHDSAGTITTPLSKQTDPSGWRMVANSRGLPAVTDWHVLARGSGRALLELTPGTGRTHQLRVHCAGMGHPIIGDPVYGTAAEGLCLLARRLVLPLDPRVEVEASMPAHIRRALQGGGIFDRLEAV
ncbi:MAG: RNA pseudouridine synthase [Acidiphilium sp.]|nr:RNA pseudouridine synthase [Acidiphilium sp.]MDD4934789.1 RNA pseudouridine synthase [Acidiphilium sp.]